MTENPLNPNAPSAEVAAPMTQELAAPDAPTKPESSLAQPANESADIPHSTPDADAAALATPPASAGALLREARQAAGVHIAALAVALKVPTRRLEALESDRWDSLPDTVFVRALAGSVCRHLKLDPQPILALLPVTASPLNSQSEVGLNEPFNSPRDGKPPSWFSQISRSALLFALVVLLAAITIALLPDAKEAGKERIVSVEVSPVNVGTTVVLPPELPVSSPAPVLEAPAPVPVVVASAPVATIKPAPVQAASNPVPAPAAPSTPVVAKPTAAPVATPAPAVVSVAAPAAVKPMQPASAPVAANASLAKPTREVLSFTAKGETWVEVIETSGKVLVRRHLNAGETVGVSGVPPLAVVVGRADQTEVTVRGQKFDHIAKSAGNVARFEVK